LKLKVCYYCGTKYAEDVERCPLCGQTEIEPEELDEVPAAVTEVPEDNEPETPRPAKKKEKPKKERGGAYHKPVEKGNEKNGGAIAVCVILALIVLAGIVFILHSVGVFTPKEPKPPVDPNPDTSLNLPVDPGTAGDGAACESITVMPTSLNLGAEGIKTRLNVSVLPAGCSEPVSYASADETVATVSADGEVTAVGEGRTAITVTCGAQTASVDVICAFESTVPVPPAATDWELKDVKLSTEDFTLFSVGETAIIKVLGLPENKTVDVKWEINDTGVATLENGKVTAVASGKATVTVTVGGKKLTCIVRCSIKDAPAAPKPDGGSSTGGETPATDDGIVKLRSFDITFTRAGEVSYNTVYTGNTRLVAESWTSADPAICTVEVMADNSAKFTAVASGTTKVTAVYDGKSYDCVVRCVFSES